MRKFQLYPTANLQKQGLSEEDKNAVKDVIRPLIEDGADCHQLVTAAAAICPGLSGSEVTPMAEEIETRGRSMIAEAEELFLDEQVAADQVVTQVQEKQEYAEFDGDKLLAHFQARTGVKHPDNIRNVLLGLAIDDELEPVEIQVEICSVSRLLPNPWCENLILVTFEEGSEPTETCSVCQETIVEPTGAPKGL